MYHLEFYRKSYYWLSWDTYSNSVCTASQFASWNIQCVAAVTRDIANFED